MAKQKHGINGPLSGKIGPVVAASWKGIPVLRARPSKSKSKKGSPKQIAQQKRFAMAAKLVQPFAELFPICFETGVGEGYKNQAMRFLLRTSIYGVYPKLAVDYSTVTLSRGSLPKAVGAQVSSTSKGQVKFSWNDNSHMGSASVKDQVILIIYSEELKEAQFSVSSGTRKDKKAMLKNNYFSGKKVHTWISFLASNKKDAADSVYTGVIRVK